MESAADLLDKLPTDEKADLLDKLPATGKPSSSSSTATVEAPLAAESCVLGQAHAAPAEGATCLEQAAVAEPATKEVPSREEVPTQEEAKVSATPAAAPAANESAPQSAKSHDDYEKCSGLRITNRCVSAVQMAQQVEGAKIMRIGRLMELRQRAQCNRIVIGVLCEWFTGKLANGEIYTRWSLTDLAEPEPKELIVQLRGRAYDHWRKAAVAKTATRKSIFAIMNPVLVESGGTNKDWTVRVENPSQLAKIGECPSLGLCAMKGCQVACNLDFKDRFCKTHLRLAYANKGGRILTGGNANAQLLLGPKRKLLTQHQPKEEEEEEDPERIERAKKLKTKVAMQMDERRFSTYEANDNYLRSIVSGRKAQSDETSRVPVLGRSFDESVPLEVDMATIPTTDKFKAERMIERMVDKRAKDRVNTLELEQMQLDGESMEQMQLGAASTKSSAKASSSTRSSSTSKASAKPTKKTLAELMEALKGRKTARRAGVVPNPPAADKPKRQAVAGSPHDAAVPNAVAHGPDVNVLLKDLTNAGEDMSRIKAVLDAADGLPISAFEEPQGFKFYSAVGSLSMHSSRADIRRAALLARRRWRSASFDKQQATIAQETTSAAQESEMAEENAAVAHPSVEVPTLAPGSMETDAPAEVAETTVCEGSVEAAMSTQTAEPSAHPSGGSAETAEPSLPGHEGVVPDEASASEAVAGAPLHSAGQCETSMAMPLQVHQESKQVTTADDPMGISLESQPPLSLEHGVASGVPSPEQGGA